MSEEKAAIGKVIKLLRTSKKMKVAELAKKSGVSNMFILELENTSGAMAASRLNLICYVCEALDTNLLDVIILASKDFKDKLTINSDKYNSLIHELRLEILENNEII